MTSFSLLQSFLIPAKISNFETYRVIEFELLNVCWLLICCTGFFVFKKCSFCFLTAVKGSHCMSQVKFHYFVKTVSSWEIAYFLKHAALLIMKEAFIRSIMLQYYVIAITISVSKHSALLVLLFSPDVQKYTVPQFAWKVTFLQVKVDRERFYLD